VTNAVTTTTNQPQLSKYAVDQQQPVVKSSWTGKQTARQAGIYERASHCLVTGRVAVATAVFADHSDALQVAATRAQTVRHSNRHFSDAWSDARVDCVVTVRLHNAACVATCSTVYPIQSNQSINQLIMQSIKSISQIGNFYSWPKTPRLLQSPPKCSRQKDRWN